MDSITFDSANGITHRKAKQKTTAYDNKPRPAFIVNPSKNDRLRGTSPFRLFKARS